MMDDNKLLSEISSLRSLGKSIRNIAELLNISWSKVERSLNLIALTCSSCGLRNVKNAKFCEQCGERIKPLCGECVSPIVLAAKFCPFCGTEVSGKASQPISVDDVASPSSESKTDVPLAESGSPRLAPFVGRRQELDDLTSALEESLTGKSRIAMLAGESGIGKTRTAFEIASRAQQLGAATLWGRCHETQEALPYWPWVQVLRSYVQRCESKALREIMGVGAGDLTNLLPELHDLFPDLKPSPAPVVFPDQARFRLFDSITMFLLNAAKREPLIIFLDDLHWSDKPSLMLLEFLSQAMDEDRILVVGTYRDTDISRHHPLSDTLGELSRLTNIGKFRRLLLRGLNGQEIRQFLEVGSGVIPPEQFVEAIYAQTEGNPFFISELVRFIMQDGVPSPESMTNFSRDISGIPESVREVVGRGLSGLSNECNSILTFASVIGRDFGLDVLSKLINQSSGSDLLEAFRRGGKS